MWWQVLAGAAATATVAVVIPLGLDLHMPVPEINPLTVEKIALGRQLFFDQRLSRDQSLSCSSCHRPDLAFSDARAVAIGVAGRPGRRNAPALVNRGYGRLFFWDGRSTSLEEQVVKPISDPDEMDLPIEEAAARVGLEPQDISRSLASYVRSILSGNSAFDRFVNGDRGALSDEEQFGLRVFRGKGNCTTCHGGPNFTDERTHNTGVAWTHGQFADDGAGHGAFKTPTLREVSHSAPYMHDGSLTTLDDVVEFYDRGGNANPYLDPEVRPARFTQEEKRAVIAFLRVLEGKLQEGVLVASLR